MRTVVSTNVWRAALKVDALARAKPSDAVEAGGNCQHSRTVVSTRVTVPRPNGAREHCGSANSAFTTSLSARNGYERAATVTATAAAATAADDDAADALAVAAAVM